MTEGTREAAFSARDAYRAGRITREECERACEPFAREYDRLSREAAKRHGVRPRLFSLAAFLR